MYSNTEVANLALGHLGSSYKIVNVETENSNMANIVRKHYSSALDTILAKHNWQFATKQGAMLLVEEDPSVNWKYSYRMPVDAAVIRRISVEGGFFYKDEYLDEKEPFQIFYDSTHGYVIHTNVYNAYAEYTVRVADVGPFLNHFARAFAAQLALDIAPQVITNNYFKVKEVLRRDLKNEIAEQMAEDISLNPAPIPSDSPFVRVR